MIFDLTHSLLKTCVWIRYMWILTLWINQCNQWRLFYLCWNSFSSCMSNILYVVEFNCFFLEFPIKISHFDNFISVVKRFRKRTWYRQRANNTIWSRIVFSPSFCSYIFESIDISMIRSLICIFCILSSCRLSAVAPTLSPFHTNTNLNIYSRFFHAETNNRLSTVSFMTEMIPPENVSTQKFNPPIWFRP